MGYKNIFKNRIVDGHGLWEFNCAHCRAVTGKLSVSLRSFAEADSLGLEDVVVFFNPEKADVEVLGGISFNPFFVVEAARKGQEVLFLVRGANRKATAEYIGCLGNNRTFSPSASPNCEFLGPFKKRNIDRLLQGVFEAAELYVSKTQCNIRIAYVASEFVCYLTTYGDFDLAGASEEASKEFNIPNVFCGGNVHET